MKNFNIYVYKKSNIQKGYGMLKGKKNYSQKQIDKQFDPHLKMKIASNSRKELQEKLRKKYPVKDYSIVIEESSWWKLQFMAFNNDKLNKVVYSAWTFDITTSTCVRKKKSLKFFNKKLKEKKFYIFNN